MSIDNKRFAGVIGYIALLIVLLVLAVITDQQLCGFTFFRQLFEFVNSMSDIFFEDLLDMHEIVWGTAITITIFLLEISNQYRYGISLKTVINYSLKSGTVFVGMIGYLLLYPMMCLAVRLSMKCVAIWCAGTALFTFGSGLAFSLLIFRRSSVIRLIQSLTIERIKKRTEKKRKKDPVWHRWIDSLPITDFIIHINYENAEENSCLVNTLAKVINNVWKETDYIDWDVVDMTLVTTWSGHIIYMSGMKTEKEKSRTIRLLVELLEKLPEEGRGVYTIQILIPFIEMRDGAGVEMLCRFLRVADQDEADIILYLLLYTEYRYWFEDNQILEWCNSEKQYPWKWIESILAGKKKPDKELAWCFWRSWILYNRHDGQFGLDYFYAFCEDAEMIKTKKRYEFNSAIYKKLLEER